MRIVPAPGAVTLAEFGPGSPALLLRGRVEMLASPLEGTWNEFPLNPSFVPWLYQTLEELASRTRPVAVEVGGRWVRPVPVEWKGLPLRLVDPDGAAVPLDLLQGGTRLRSAPLERPGLYRLLVSGRPAEGLAVTLPAAEADLKALSARDLARLFPGAHRVEGSLRETVMRRRYGRELWRECLMAALLFFVMETAVARYTVAVKAAA